MFLKREMFIKAIAHLEQATELATQNVHVYNDLGIAYGKEKNFEKAIKYYKEAIAVDHEIRHRLFQPRGSLL